MKEKALKIEGLPIRKCEHQAEAGDRWPGRCNFEALYRVELEGGAVTYRCATHLKDFVAEQPFEKKYDQEKP